MPGKKAGVLAVLLAFQEPTTWRSSARPEIRPRIVRKQLVTGKVNVVDVGLHFSTAIRLPEAVSSVVVGDPALFKVEHSEKEPRLVFVKSLTRDPAQTNLLVSTVGGTSVSVLLRTTGEQIRTPGSTG